MTSNLGSAEIFSHVAAETGTTTGTTAGGEGESAAGPPLASGEEGFQTGGSVTSRHSDGCRVDRSALKAKVMEHVKNHFRPGKQLRNRRGHPTGGVIQNLLPDLVVLEIRDREDDTAWGSPEGQFKERKRRGQGREGFLLSLLSL